MSTKPEVKQHEYLMKEYYYESRRVGTRGRKDKTCEHCGETIFKGTPHEEHHFYPEFESYPTCLECSKPFRESLRDEANEEY